MTRSRIVVVGAGAWGLPAAAELAHRGHDVTLVDRHGVGNLLSSSAGPTRLWRLSHPDTVRVRLAQRSVAAMDRLATPRPASRCGCFGDCSGATLRPSPQSGMRWPRPASTTRTSIPRTWGGSFLASDPTTVRPSGSSTPVRCWPPSRCAPRSRSSPPMVVLLEIGPVIREVSPTPRGRTPRRRGRGHARRRRRRPRAGAWSRTLARHPRRRPAAATPSGTGGAFR